MQFLLLKRKKFSQYNFRMIIFQRNVFTMRRRCAFFTEKYVIITALLINSTYIFP